MKSSKGLACRYVDFIIGDMVEKTSEDRKKDIFVFTHKLNNRMRKKPYPVGVFSKCEKDNKWYFRSYDKICIGAELMGILYQFHVKLKLGAVRYNEETKELEAI